jgi:hypothetical protein
MKIVGPNIEWTLQESPQKNPIRWRILKQQKDDQCSPQTSFFRCKDYFNDVVAAYRGKFFTEYGFNNKLIDLSDDKLLVQIKFLENKENYCATLNAAINPKLEAEGLPKLVYDDVEGETDTLVLFFDRKLFDNTYTISLLTYLLRIANQVDAHATYESLVTSMNAKTDRPFYIHYDKVVSGKFQSPLNEPFWWWTSANYNSKKQEDNCQGGWVHNNGCYSWMNGITSGL